MAGSENFFYWDTAIFISWLSGEVRQDPFETAGIAELVNLFDRDIIQVFTSVITIIEILQSRLNNNAFTQFERLVNRRNFHFVDGNRRIAKTAQEIRDYYSRLGDEVGATLTTPDAIHLATADYRKCSKFYTFDGKNRSGKNRALVPLSRTIAGKFYLEIEKPYPKNPTK